MNKIDFEEIEKKPCEAKGCKKKAEYYSAGLNLCEEHRKMLRNG